MSAFSWCCALGLVTTSRPEAIVRRQDRDGSEKKDPAVATWPAPGRDSPMML
jgi:hypothetical protein